MAKLNLDKELKLINLLGYKIKKIDYDDSEQTISIYSKDNVEGGHINVTKLPNGKNMNQVVIDQYGSKTYCCDWVSGIQGALYFNIDKYHGMLNIYDFPCDRLLITKDKFSVGFGLFDFTCNNSKKTKEDIENEKKYCSDAKYGFYLHFSSDNGTTEYLLFSNMKQDQQHKNKTYIHSSITESIAVKNTTLDIENIAKNDTNGMEFFNKMRELLNSIIPCEEDIFTFLISNEEIEKYGLSVYIEPKVEKQKKTGDKKTKK